MHPTNAETIARLTEIDSFLDDMQRSTAEAADFLAELQEAWVANSNQPISDENQHDIAHVVSLLRAANITLEVATETLSNLIDV